MSEKIREIMKDMIIFHGLSDDRVDKLIQKLNITAISRGDIVCSEGEMGRDLYVILNGEVEVTKLDHTGEKHSILHLKERDSFGEMTLIDVQKRSATVTAVTDTTLASLSFKALADIYFEDVEMYTMIILNIAREFSRRLRHMDDQFVEFFHLSLNDLVHMRKDDL